MIKSVVTATFLFLGANNMFAQETPEKPALPVQVFKIEDKKQTTTKTYPAIIKSYEEVDVMARVKGTLVEKYFKEGEFVKKGTLLYKIEQNNYLANLNAQKANLAKAQANFKKAQKDYQRGKNLIATNSISAQNFDLYTYEFENASSLLENAKAEVQKAQIELDYTKVTAPIDGIVGLKKSDIGDLVGSDSSNSLLVTITNTNPVYVEFSLSKDDVSSYLSQIKNKKTKVALVINEKVYENGDIDFISAKLDANTDTLLLRAKFDNKNSDILIGEFGKIQISNLELGDVFVVPENAILKTSQGSFVYVVVDSVAKLKPVETGILVKEGIVIKSGLTPNEQIVISNIAKLKPDTKIQILNKEK